MKHHKQIKLIECPRDAMQGWPHMISTGQKVQYINALLKVGFDTIDFGSFVSPKAIPQMADTKEVLTKLDLADSVSSLLAIIANMRGAEDAMQFDAIQYLGFPFSISETFQQRNTNSSISQSFDVVRDIQELCLKNNKKLVIYISMGFGNPYGDPYDETIVFDWVNKLTGEGIEIISLADTVGLAEPGQVNRVTGYLVNALPDIEIGVHLHSTPANRNEKLQAALEAGCNRFDGAIKGIGGCPMAADTLVGNMDTEGMIEFFEEQGFPIQLNKEALAESIRLAGELFV
ncbi:MAG: hydroxymethylglutaryl-CoA lyase [Ferruginibacter sp.]